MKSKTSFFNGAIFRKNLTRFAPCWAIYTVCAFMGMFLILDSWFSQGLIEAIQLLSVVTPCYALICAQLLFGDLYSPRMCNALHALPLRRETWLGTNLISGLVFHLIPTGSMALVSALILIFNGETPGAMASLFWFVGVNLQFLCFFGIAVCSAFCMGSRFAHGVVYFILNFISGITGWLVDTLYVSQFHGVQLDTTPFIWFTPVSNMIAEPFLTAWSYRGDASIMVTEQVLFQYVQDGDKNICFGLGSGLGWYFGYAVAGLGLMALSFALYRHRKLECAGDFIAVGALEPVFQLLYTLCIGALFHVVADAFFGLEAVLFLYVGLVLGWFTGRMLLERTIRVFRKQSILRCGGVLAAFTLTLLVAIWDPMGIESWVPRVEEVKSITISNSYNGTYGASLLLDTPEDMETLINLHQKTLDNYYARRSNNNYLGTYTVETAEVLEITKEEYENQVMSFGCTIQYRLKNGQVKERHYYLELYGQDREFLKNLYSRPEAVFGYPEDVENFLDGNDFITFCSAYDSEQVVFDQEEELRSLYEALMADCHAGNLAQIWDFHPTEKCLYWLYADGNSFNIFSDSVNTLAWLRSQGVDVDLVMEQMTKG